MIFRMKTKDIYYRGKKDPEDDLPGFPTCARGFEPPTPWSVAKCSIQLSYAHILTYMHFASVCNAGDRNRTGTDVTTTGF